MQQAKNKGIDFVLPDDVVIAEKLSEDADYKTVNIDKIPPSHQGLDIGDKTVEKFKNYIKDAKTIIWNGPLGVFEIENFAKATKEIANAVSESDAVVIIGGGETAQAVKKFGYGDKITHISTGGGASLEFMEGKELPGISVLPDKEGLS
jgi:phosphoglycerate kinase